MVAVVVVEVKSKSCQGPLKEAEQETKILAQDTLHNEYNTYS
jgi:hypothetical protein